MSEWVVNDGFINGKTGIKNPVDNPAYSHDTD